MANPIDSISNYIIRRLTDSKRGCADQEVVLNSTPRFARILTWVLISTAGFSVTWLAVARTDEVVTSQGTLEPSGNVKTIQVPTGGVVSDIAVKEGELVKKDQVLLRVDRAAALSRAAALRDSINNKNRQIQLKSSEMAQFFKTNQAEESILTKSLHLQQRILKKISGLASVGASTELQMLQQKQQVQEVLSDLQKLRSERSRQESAYQQQIVQMRTELRSLENELVELRVNLNYQDIRSPVSGRVFDLKPKAIGFVAQATEPVMKIVPLDNLVADIFIPSSKIGFVSVGRQVDISIDSFPATDFGILKGHVERIGSNALPPDQVSPYYRYPATVSLSSQTLQTKRGFALPLQVGMSVTANIKLRKVSYLQLLLSDFKDKASTLREI